MNGKIMYDVCLQSLRRDVFLGTTDHKIHKWHKIPYTRHGLNFRDRQARIPSLAEHCLLKGALKEDS